MGTILVATNFSKTSDNAVLYAAHLAKLFKAKLVLFNVFKLPVHASNTWLSAESMDAMVAVNRNRLKEQALGIDSLMEIHKARFLVMGMSAKSMEQNLMGNPTTTLISMKKFPVLAVPVNAKFMGIDKILFACDLMQGIPLRILVRLKQIALGLKSEVTVFYVEQKLDELKEDNDVFEHIDRGLENVVHFYKKVNSDKVIWEIEKEIIDSNSNLLVMIPKKYGFWESLIHRSKTREMASGLNIPMLSIPID